MVGADTQAKRIRLDDGTSVCYYTLVLATGAKHSYFAHPDWEQHAPELKTLEDATTIRRSILAAFEAAEKTDNLDTQRANLTFAIV